MNCFTSSKSSVSPRSAPGVGPSQARITKRRAGEICDRLRVSTFVIPGAFVPRGAHYCAGSVLKPRISPGSIHRRCASKIIGGGYIVRQLAAVLLSCALYSIVLLASSPSEAHAQGYDGSGQAVVEDAQAYVGTPYGWGMDCSGFTSACTCPTPQKPSTLTGRPPTGKPATWCSSTRQ